VQDQAAPNVLPPRRLLFKSEEAAAMLGVGRTTLYELLAAGAIESVCIGSCRRVPLEALVDYVAGLRAGVTAERAKGGPQAGGQMSGAAMRGPYVWPGERGVYSD
jgi:excisionase family DNA binding protein